MKKKKLTPRQRQILWRKQARQRWLAYQKKREIVRATQKKQQAKRFDQAVKGLKKAAKKLGVRGVSKQQLVAIQAQADAERIEKLERQFEQQKKEIVEGYEEKLRQMGQQVAEFKTELKEVLPQLPDNLRELLELKDKQMDDSYPEILAIAAKYEMNPRDAYAYYHFGYIPGVAG
jgi:hypothetical protein